MSGFEVQVVARPRVMSQSAREYARRKISHLDRYTPRPVLFARVELDRMADPSLERPVLAKAMLDVSGRQLRAQVTAARLNEAVDLLNDRLRHQLEHLSGQLRAGRRGRGPVRRASDRHDRPRRVLAGQGSRQ
jgi:ribosome-associated translation inhibitor RaiA